jgi:hypothetical protein
METLTRLVASTTKDEKESIGKEIKMTYEIAEEKFEGFRVGEGRREVGA